MFGSNDQQANQQDDTVPAMAPVTDDMINDVSVGSAPAAQTFDAPDVSLPGQTTVSPTDDTSASTNEPTSAPAPETSPEPAPAEHEEQLLTTGQDDDLLRIKQDALHELSPLVDHLEQSPEEKFRTTMMMIQASDDQSLIQTAYNAAKNIEDDKVRAQALLDIINEINYFTQQAK